jgi:hypothetical protein
MFNPSSFVPAIVRSVNDFAETVTDRKLILAMFTTFTVIGGTMSVAEAKDCVQGNGGWMCRAIASQNPDVRVIEPNGRVVQEAKRSSGNSGGSENSPSSSGGKFIDLVDPKTGKKYRFQQTN